MSAIMKVVYKFISAHSSSNVAQSHWLSEGDGPNSHLIHKFNNQI